MKRGIALALLIIPTLITAARSQTAASIGLEMRSLKRANNGPASGPAPEGPADPVSAPVAAEPDAVQLATQILRDEYWFDSASTRPGGGGLWVSGDVTDAFARLCWIVGVDNANLLQLGSDNMVTLNAAELSRAAGTDQRTPLEAARLIADYISADEGLLLLLQVTQSSYRYLLHVGLKAPTAASELGVRTILNMDNRFDSRINPRRRNRAKLDEERPPKGFDSLVAINPSTRWLNLRTGLVVPPGNMTFHELAEAYLKVELGLDYVTQGRCIGAHDTAIQREERLMSQRALADGPSTSGENRVLTANNENPGLLTKRVRH